MTVSRGIGRGGRRLGAGRKPKPRTAAPIAAAQDTGLQVEQMAAFGERHEVIPSSLGLSVAELRRRYADELEYGPARQRCVLIGMLFDAARAGNVSALLFLERQTRTTIAKREAERSALDDAAQQKRPRLAVVNG